MSDLLGCSAARARSRTTLSCVSVSTGYLSAEHQDFATLTRLRQHGA
jgi:hypothetical protein